LTGFSDRCRSEARDGASGAVGWEEFGCLAVGEIIENMDPSNSVTGYTRRAAEGSDAGRDVAVMVADKES
jgi:hypothetical protein